MSQHTKALEEIVKTKRELEKDIAQAVSKVMAEWQSKTELSIDSIYISLGSIQSIESAKKAIISSVDVSIENDL